MSLAVHRHDGLFERGFLWIKAFATLYVVAIPLAHGLLPHDRVWEIALFFLIAMLFTYPVAALTERRCQGVEFAISLGLVVLGCVGFAVAPVLIVLAIFLHGVWDLLKHNGTGVPFFGWYCLGCVAVDWSYAAALLFYLYYGVV